MGIFSSKKQVEELKTALIGAYVFSKLKDEDQIETIFFRIYTRLHEGGYDDPEDRFGTAPAIVQGGLFADAMIELDIPHGVNGFSWTFIPNPFNLAVYTQKVQLKALNAIRKLGIDPKTECFPEQPEGNKMVVEEAYDGNLVDGIKHDQDTYTYSNGDKYVGEWKDSKRHGQGTMTYAKGEKYVGEWEYDKKHGHGTYTYADGDKYVGEWKDGKMHGQGTITITCANGDKYVGEWKNSKMHGQGTMTCANGDKYVGEWKDGEQHGYGTMTYVSGDKHVGEWKDGKMHGQGTHTWANGDKYVGEWKDDNRHGQGIYTESNGDKYEGEWEYDEKHGHGTMTYASGDKYVGEWKDGLENGHGTYTWANGKKYVGESKDGKMHGQGTMIYANGNRYVGEWKDGGIIKKKEDDDEGNQVEEEDDDNFAPTENEEQVGIFKKKIPDRYSLESSLATLIDNIDHEMFTNPNSYIVMRKDYTFSCVVAVRAGDVDDDEAILEKVRIRALEPWYTNLSLQKGAGTSLQDPGLHMLTDGFARHTVGILLEKL